MHELVAPQDGPPIDEPSTSKNLEPFFWSLSFSRLALLGRCPPLFLTFFPSGVPGSKKKIFCLFYFPVFTLSPEVETLSILPDKLTSRPYPSEILMYSIFSSSFFFRLNPRLPCFMSCLLPCDDLVSGGRNAKARYPPGNLFPNHPLPRPSPSICFYSPSGTCSVPLFVSLLF